MALFGFCGPRQKPLFKFIGVPKIFKGTDQAGCVAGNHTTFNAILFMSALGQKQTVWKGPLLATSGHWTIH